MNLNCIIDTCSCIHLSNFEFRQKTLLNYLNEKAALKYSREVHVELRDHKDKNLPTFIHDGKRKIGTSKFSIPEYERRMIGYVIPTRKKHGNKGEINNFLVSVDQIHSIKKNSVILISDDENGTVSEWAEAFPVIKIWSSYDVVLYLYAEKVIPSKDIALEMIKSIISFSAPVVSKRSEKTTEKLTRTLKSYSKKIDNISKLLN